MSTWQKESRGRKQDSREQTADGSRQTEDSRRRAVDVHRRTTRARRQTTAYRLLHTTYRIPPTSKKAELTALGIIIVAAAVIIALVSATIAITTNNATYERTIETSAKGVRGGTILSDLLNHPLNESAIIADALRTSNTNTPGIIQEYFSSREKETWRYSLFVNQKEVASSVRKADTPVRVRIPILSTQGSILNITLEYQT